MNADQTGADGAERPGMGIQTEIKQGTEMYGLQQRWFSTNDTDEILEIDNLSFVNPWTEKDLYCFMKTSSNICRVAIVNNEIVGYMFYELAKTRFIIHRIAVHSSCWGMGAASFLVGVLVDHLSTDRRSEISLMVRERNLGAQLFFQKIGFACVDIAKEHYDNHLNLAMATGQLSGIVVIDCESEEDARWFAANKSNSPIKVQTPRGFHFWFKHPGYHVPNAAKVKDENGQSRYDIRGDGGYVLIPNSKVTANEKDIHVSGAYQWRGNLNDLDSLPLFNQSWGQSSQAPAQDNNAIRNGTEYIKRIFAVAGQGGHGATWQAVNCLRESGMSQTEATFAMLRWNETNANPPWSEKELQHKIEDAYGRSE